VGSTVSSFSFLIGSLSSFLIGSLTSLFSLGSFKFPLVSLVLTSLAFSLAFSLSFFKPGDILEVGEALIPFAGLVSA